MSVYQGDIVRITRRDTNEDIGWYQKLRVGGAVKYCSMNGMDDINPKLVDREGSEYTITRQISGKDILMTFSFDDNMADHIANDKITTDNILLIDKMIQRSEKEYISHLTEANKYKQRTADLLSIKDKIIIGSDITYLYGKFRDQYNDIQYCWIVPESEESSQYYSGQIISVVDRNGNMSELIITKIEKSRELKNVKLLGAGVDEQTI